ncbi:transglutaminase family protein [Aeromicrobium halocynthiae]|uniref:Transglutaminase family protein n=1 Tax=Aeromicrobium halocynthiae TaxID=560557 RepID=A0ABN2W096_9ACTN
MRHRTRYTYDDVVTDSYGHAVLLPRDVPGQRVLSAQVDVDPVAVDRSEDIDHFGNRVTYLQVDVPHTRLTVEADLDVEVEPASIDPEALGAPWEAARPRALDGVPAWEVVELALESPSIGHGGAVLDYARPSFPPGRALGEAARDLMHRVHDDFAYEPGTTSVTSTIDDVLAARAGVCQDFAQLMIACLRSQGLAARYVSGYLATDPPPGRERVVGADATHAWVAVWTPAGEWLALDPTNDQPVGERYVTIAWGREYADVSPLKGVIVSEASSSELEVQVDVLPA